MACGIPAVVSNIPVLVETTGNNALVANPKRPVEWEKAFSTLENQTFYENMKTNGLKWVKPIRGPNAWQEYIEDIKHLLFNN